MLLYHGCAGAATTIATVFVSEERVRELWGYNNWRLEGWRRVVKEEKVTIHNVRYNYVRGATSDVYRYLYVFMPL